MAQINFNYSPSYHAYAYSLVYSPGAEQNPVNLSTWGEPGATDLCNNYSPAQSYYSPATAAPTGPEEPAHGSAQWGYHGGLSQHQGPGMVYLSDTEAGRLLMSGQGQPRGHETRLTGSETASDSEPQISPDSWSSGSSGEAGLPQADPSSWTTNLDDETSSTSPDSTEDIPRVKEEPQTYCVLGSDYVNKTTASESVIAPKTPGTKGKVRAAFSETQMNILTQRFNAQRYLTPAEMKNMAALTGLTYKQVKTWFQNRRMKLRRHQKENTWVSERYTLKDTNLATSHMQPHRGQAREPYNPHAIEAALKKSGPQNLALYLAAVGGANGSAGYPSWPSNAPQGTVAPGWPLPADAPQFAYNARFNTQSEAEQVNRVPNNSIMAQSSTQ